MTSTISKSPTTARNRLVREIRGTAEWRAEVAERYDPDDGARCISASNALHSLARFVEQLPADEWQVQELGKCKLSKEAARRLSRHGMHSDGEPTDDQHRRLLAQVLGTQLGSAARSAPQRAKEHIDQLRKRVRGLRVLQGEAPELRGQIDEDLARILHEQEERA